MNNNVATPPDATFRLLISAYDAATLAREHMAQLQALFAAIGRLVPQGSEAGKLVDIGRYLAGDHHNVLDCECAELDQEMARIRPLVTNHTGAAPVLSSSEQRA